MIWAASELSGQKYFMTQKRQIKIFPLLNNIRDIQSWQAWALWYDRGWQQAAANQLCLQDYLYEANNNNDKIIFTKLWEFHHNLYEKNNTEVGK